MGIDCSSIAGIERVDLSKFIIRLARERERRCFNFTEQRVALGFFMLFSSIFTGGIGGGELFEHLRFGKGYFRSKRIPVILSASTLPLILLGYLLVDDRKFCNIFFGGDVEQGLVEEIRRGVVRGNNESGHGILEQFTSFLNQYGKRVN